MLEFERFILLDKHIIKEYNIEVLETIKVCTFNILKCFPEGDFENRDDVDYFRDTYLETLVSYINY